MREEVITVVRYSPRLRRETVFRLTYAVGEGPRPDLIRWFLLREEMENLQDREMAR